MQLDSIENLWMNNNVHIPNQAAQLLWKKRQFEQIAIHEKVLWQKRTLQFLLGRHTSSKYNVIFWFFVPNVSSSVRRTSQLLNGLYLNTIRQHNLPLWGVALSNVNLRCLLVSTVQLVPSLIIIRLRQLSIRSL